MALVLVVTVIGSFQVFDIVAVTTKGGPANTSNVLQMYIYDKAFGQFDFGYASRCRWRCSPCSSPSPSCSTGSSRADASDLD